MATNEELARKIDQIEREQRSKWRLFLQFIVSPLLLLIIGYFLTGSIERAKEDFQHLQLEVKRIETAQIMLRDLFSNAPERAFVADRLMSKLVDETLSKQISEIVFGYYSSKNLNKRLSGPVLDKAAEIVGAAEAIGGPAADKIKTKLYYIVVASKKPGKRDKAEAIECAKKLQKKYKSKVHYSDSGYFVVTVGRLPLNKAKSLLTKVIESEDGREDSYLIPGNTFTKQIYPESEGVDVGSKAAED